MSDIVINEPAAVLRTLRLVVLDNLGNLLAGNHAFAAGDFKLIKPDGSIANSVNLPTSLANSVLAGRFEAVIAQAEIAVQVGNYSLQAVAANLSPQEWGFTVGNLPAVAQSITVAQVLGAILEGPNQFDGLGEAQPVGDATVYDVTLAQALREILAYAAGNALNLDGLTGNPILKSRVGGRNRVVIALNNGNRTITSRDDR